MGKLKSINVSDKKDNQYILYSDGTWCKVNNFKVGDTFKFIKKWKTSEGDIEIGDIFKITTVWDSIYWIKCLNRKGDKWSMGAPLMYFNDINNIYYIKIN